MDYYWFFLILGLLQVICLWIGYQASKKHKSQSDYYLAGRTLTFFPLLMTFVATQVGGGLILGSAEEAYRYGWKIIFYPLGSISGFILLSSFLGKRLAELPVSTVAQIFEVVYGSKTLKKIASLFSMMTLLMITVAQVIASQKFLACFQLDHPVWFFLFWMIVFFYTMWAGMEGISSIDAIQASYFLVALGLSALFLVKSSHFAPQMILDTLFDSSKQTLSESPPLVGWFFMPMLFMLIEQDMAQRCFSARSSVTVRRAALGSALIVLLVCLIPILFGITGKALGIPITPGSSVLLSVVQATCSPLICAAVACAVLMAIISTAVSLIHSISSNLAQDFEFRWLQNSSHVWTSKALTLGIGMVALGMSYFFTNIVDILILSYELSVVCLFVPILMSLLNGTGKKISASFAIGSGAIAFVGCRVFNVPFPHEIFEVLASAVGYGLGSLIATQKTKIKAI